MKNTLAALFQNAPSATARREALAMRTAAAYAGIAPEDAVFHKILLSGDTLGTVYELEFRNTGKNAGRCGMEYCCYVDAFTGEVRGFMATPGSVPYTQVLRA